MHLAGGIDLGGTKIEARLFAPDEDWRVVSADSTPTPNADYEALVDALAQAAESLFAAGASTVGVGTPGLVNARTGRMLTANLPASGRTLPADLEARTGRALPFINDCRAFTLSEARLGAGRGHRSVLGLILGTGMAGGFAYDGQIVDGPNGQAGEFGHMRIAHDVMAKHALPFLTCGCGRQGCYETLVAGNGLRNLSKHMTGTATEPEQLVERAMSGDAEAEAVLDVWSEIVGSLLTTLSLAFDPDLIVLGGGLSKVPDVTGRLTRAAEQGLLPETSFCPIALAEGGDRSGARGAALFARMVERGSEHG